MGRLKSLAFTVLLPSLIVLAGCEDLVPHDTQSLLDPNLRRSEVVGIVAGFGTTFAAMPDTDCNAEAAIKCWHESKDGGNHGSVSDSLGLLWFIDCVATRGDMEHHRGICQFAKRSCVLLLRPQRTSPALTPSILCNRRVD